MAAKRLGIGKTLRIFYSPNYPVLLVVKLQEQKYALAKFHAWYWGSDALWTDKQVDKALRKVLWRQSQLLLIGGMFTILLQLLLGFSLVWLWFWRALSGGWQFGVALVVLYPIVTPYMLMLLVVGGRALRRIFRRPKEART